jgi:hypothetical protein
MGIHTRLDRVVTADRRRLADDLLARVVVDHVAMRHQEVAVVNRDLVGIGVPYTVMVNGVLVGTGVGELLAPHVTTAVRDLVVRQTRTIPTVQFGVAFLFTAAMLATLANTRRKRIGEDDPLVWIAKRLRERSPVLSGDYRDAHILFADGKEVGTAADVIAGMEVPAADVYAFANTVPYSRKIEIGKTKDGRDFVIQVPNRIYERTANDAKGRFSSIAVIEFGLRGVISGTIYGKSGPRPRTTAKFGRVSRRPAAPQNRPDIRYPTIIVRYR